MKFVAAIVGRTDYEPDFFRKLVAFVQQHDLGDSVVFTGPVSREQVLSAYRACALHVLPVRFMNSGTINSETWASGRPIIQSSRVDPNYVEEGVNGMTFDVDNREQLAEKIRFLLAVSPGPVAS